MLDMFDMFESSLAIKSLRGQPTKTPHVIVKASPYSGTKGICRTLRSVGREIGHEFVDNHGISSWYHSHFTRQDYVDVGFDEDATILHQVRHPLMVISTLMGVVNLPWKIQRGIIKLKSLPAKLSDNHLEQAMIFWYYWNFMAEVDADYTYRIESLQFEWKEFLAALKLEPRVFPKHNVAAHRHTRRQIFSWNHLFRTNADLTMAILELADSYGYVQVPYSYLRDKYYKFPQIIVLTAAKSPCL